MPTMVTTKGQVTIPKRVREYLGIEPGTAVRFDVLEDGQVVLRRAIEQPPPVNPFDRLLGMAGPGPSTDEIMWLLRPAD